MLESRSWEPHAWRASGKSFMRSSFGLFAANLNSARIEELQALKLVKDNCYTAEEFSVEDQELDDEDFLGGGRYSGCGGGVDGCSSIGVVEDYH